MPYSSSSCFCLLYRTIDICVSCFRAVKIVLGVQCSHTDYWMFDMAPHGKETEDLRIRIVALHKDGLGYKKFGNSLELSWSTVARTIQRFSKIGLTQNRPRKGRSKKLSPCAVRQVQKLASKNRCMSAASIALEVAEAEGRLFCESASEEASFWDDGHADHTAHTATSRSAWPSSQKEASSEADSQKSLQIVYWRQPGQEHELLEPCPVIWLRWCPACVAMPWWGEQSKLCLAYSQAWWW